MEDQTVTLPRYHYRRLQTSRLLSLPHELISKICSYIIPSDRVFCFLLATDVDFEGRGALRHDGFYFDRGYGFPFFQTSFLTVHSTIYDVCMSLWLRTSPFRFDMGEDLGRRTLVGFLPDQFIKRIVHCELLIVVPFYPGVLYQLSSAMGTFNGSWLMRRMLRRLLNLLEEEGNLREMHLTVRNKVTYSFHNCHRDGVPGILKDFAFGPLLEDLEAIEGSAREMELISGPAGLYFLLKLNRSIEERLLAIVLILAESDYDEEFIGTALLENVEALKSETRERLEMKGYSVTVDRPIGQTFDSRAVMRDGKWYLVIE